MSRSRRIRARRAAGLSRHPPAHPREDRVRGKHAWSWSASACLIQLKVRAARAAWLGAVIARRSPVRAASSGPPRVRMPTWKIGLATRPRLASLARREAGPGAARRSRTRSRRRAGTGGLFARHRSLVPAPRSWLASQAAAELALLPNLCRVRCRHVSPDVAAQLRRNAGLPGGERRPRHP